MGRAATGRGAAVRIPADAAEQAVLVHEAAARLAERSGLAQAARGHRRLAVRMRGGRTPDRPRNSRV
jgi:hypothetical protein